MPPNLLLTPTPCAHLPTIDDEQPSLQPDSPPRAKAPPPAPAPPPRTARTPPPTPPPDPKTTPPPPAPPPPAPSASRNTTTAPPLPGTQTRGSGQGPDQTQSSGAYNPSNRANPAASFSCRAATEALTISHHKATNRRRTATYSPHNPSSPC